ncbi:hypothetical protein NEOLEDRAFT_1062045 [Neolentinus lepideus HHB14362 ss-1]|uniref:Rdx family-domain-containing protein n=1 Tax=Neolentinus lepideus HHB14362 ss-1 TaxID=1314782 RepID=A0A165TNM3_9AGAM|nr:hypothetical protein NEOLEDRAFT_1062045 [Neolentinus lepideus HHB14362 ss-1]
MDDPGTSTDCIPCQQNEMQSFEQVTAPIVADLKSNLMDPSTFIPPSPLPGPSIAIEFCDRCRWLHRATWLSTELFLTFPPPTLKGITLMPMSADETAGRFRVWLFLHGEQPHLIWDRKVEGGFPELKVLKQRVRDHVQPGKSLGHSDKK